MPKKIKNSSLPIPFFIISLIIVVFDQITKLIIVRTINLFETVRILPFFNLINIRNRGAAFGLFQSLGSISFIVISLIAIAIVVFLIFRSKDDRTAFSFILGGAIGNLIDRIRLGYVVDYLDLYAGKYHWPAFNIADSFVTIGIALIFLNALIKNRLFRE